MKGDLPPRPATSRLADPGSSLRYIPIGVRRQDRDLAGLAPESIGIELLEKSHWLFTRDSSQPKLSS